MTDRESKHPQIWCVHGNLQRRSVWNCFDDLLNHPLEKEDLFEPLADSFDCWTTSFCRKVRSAGSPRNYLIGYSLGGRLALHAYLADPALWQGVIVVGADPGLTSEAARERQCSHDKQWGQRFLTEPWQELMVEWNAQEVFGGIKNPCVSTENDFNRSDVCELFDNFSKGRQRDLTQELIHQTARPVGYVSGELDKKYAGIGEGLSQVCSNITHSQVAGSGHRVPWEQPARFAEYVNNFINSIEKSL